MGLIKDNKKFIWSIIALAVIASIVTVLLLANISVKASDDFIVIDTTNLSLVEYSEDMNTDYEKLEAVYSLIEQMRLEHNRVGEIARSNWKEYQSRWVAYSKIFKSKLKPLLEEQNKLRKSVIGSLYSKDDWKKLSPDAKFSVYVDNLPDKDTAKVKATEATTPLLEQLKGVDFYSLSGRFVDPTEDFTTYTEVDENGDITVTASRVTVSTIRRDATSYVRKDMGAGHFGDFEHLYSVQLVNADSGSRCGMWCVNNGSESEVAMDTAGEGIVVRCADDWEFTTLYDFETDDYDYVDTTWSYPYWHTTSREGTTGTCLIYTDEARTSLAFTLSITTGTTAYRYIYACIACNDDTSGSSENGYYLENLDLQEAAGEPNISNTPSSENLGSVDENSTYYAYGSVPSNPVQDGECTFTITNDGSITIDIDIECTNFTGGDGWTLTGNSPGSGQLRMTAYYSGQNPANGVVLTTSPQSFYSNLTSSSTIKWDFKFETGIFTDGVAKSGTITLTASAS